jgi:hypothetical protein
LDKVWGLRLLSSLPTWFWGRINQFFSDTIVSAIVSANCTYK